MICKILIIDDEDVKAQYLAELCQYNINNADIMFAPRLASAMLNLNKEYHVVLCDRLLGDGFGETFIEPYHARWPNAKIIFYSGDEDSCTNCVGIKCHSFDAVKGEILAIAKLLPKIEDFFVPAIPPVQTVPQTEVTQRSVDVKTFIPLIILFITLGSTGLIGFTKAASKTDSLGVKLSEHCKEQKEKEIRTDEKLEKILQALTRVETKLEDPRTRR